MPRATPCRHPLVLAPVALAASALLAGCGALSPYQHMPLPGPRVVAADAVRAVPGSPAPVASPWAGDLEAAWLEVEEQRKAMFDKLDASAVRRTLGANGLYALGGWAAFNGMKPNPTDADAMRGLRLAVTGSSLYLASDHAINDAQEVIHAKAYQSLSCLMLQTRPLLWRVGERQGSSAVLGRDNWHQGHPRPPAVDSRNGLQDALANLEVGLNGAYAAHEVFTLNHESKGFAAHVRNAIKERERALSLTRTTLQEGRDLLQTLDRSGLAVRTRAAMIMAATNLDLQSKQSALPGLSSALTNLRSHIDAFSQLGKQTEADESGSGGTDSGTQTGSNGELGGGGADASTPSAPTGSGAGAGASAAAAASQTASKADLDALKASLTELIVSKKAQDDARIAIDKESAALKAKADEITRLQKENQALKAAQQQCGGASGPLCREGAPLAEYIRQTNALHALRRPVAAALVSFRKTAREASAYASCKASPQWIAITPSEARTTKVPATLEFVIGAATGGIPRVGLTGNFGGTPLKDVLDVRASDGVLTARVSLPASTPPGEVVLWATDSNGRHGEQVSITVQK